MVVSGLARRCLVQVSYAIGVPEPLSVFVDTYKTGNIPYKDILALIKKNFDFRPGMIAINLDLKMVATSGSRRLLLTAILVVMTQTSLGRLLNSSRRLKFTGYQDFFLYKQTSLLYLPPIQNFG